jgi:hypothetical protein
MSDSLKTEDISTVISEALEEGQTSPILEPETALQKRPSMYENLSTKMSDQDTQQRINVFFAFILELYRILMASFLIMFVPQKCGDEICGLTENLYNPEPLYKTTGVFNGLTFLAFLILYSIEVKRENKMIAYLHVNDENANDNDAVGEALEHLPLTKKNQILHLDQYYQKSSYFAFGFFSINTILSAFVVFNHYLDNKTFTVFLTNILFMILKLKETYAIANTEKNIFYSAYLTNKVQFNDVDPDKRVDSTDDVENKLDELEKTIESA